MFVGGDVRKYKYMRERMGERRSRSTVRGVMFAGRGETLVTTVYGAFTVGVRRDWIRSRVRHDVMSTML